MKQMILIALDVIVIVPLLLVVHMMEELQDYICIGQDNNEGDQRVLLFVKMKPQYKFSEDFAKKVQQQVLNQLTEEHVPSLVLEAKDIPVSSVRINTV